ncbi:hypothetical protein [Mesorhizobium sp. M1A.F.Ca.IN.022.06.1.1]|uniref:hypothetical protein n=1 Tax=Mesorhizobium sp. M1A.F.Ca.IN.022.06.1.1 TaxID=2493680 RepID=UPI001FE0E01F|nr:hypothetical protein [Mesorhizobium sp. M1A.F.Ca.IN.022.06.1.1]
MAFYSLAVGRLAVSPDRLLLPSALIGVALTFAWCLHDGVAAWAAWTCCSDSISAPGRWARLLFWSRALSLDQGGRLAVVAYLTPIASTLLLALSGESLSMTPWLAPSLSSAVALLSASNVRRAEDHARDRTRKHARERA